MSLSFIVFVPHLSKKMLSKSLYWRAFGRKSELCKIIIYKVNFDHNDSDKNVLRVVVCNLDNSEYCMKFINFIPKMFLLFQH